MNKIVCFAMLTALFSWVAIASADDAASDTALDPANPDAWTQREFWSTTGGEPAGAGWEFDAGEVRLARPKEAGNLVSPPLPAHFDLSWEWKITPRCNTGLKYRVREFGSRWLGVEYQIIDDSVGHPGKGSTASIYDLVAPDSDKPLRPAGDWNLARVVAAGDTLKHYLNGQLVASTAIRGPAWDTAMAMSKFYGNADFAVPREGDRVMLTDHGGEASFRNFQFTAVAPQASEEPDWTDAGSPDAGPFLGNAMRNSWADQNSIVIWTRTTARPEMLSDGKPFVSLGSREASRLSKSTDPEKLLRVQLPEGAELKDMLGACPGAPGQVRLTWFPEKQRHLAKSTSWQTTSADNDFAVQWSLQDLKPATRYAAVVEARPIDQDANTAVVRGAFRTAPEASAAEPISFCFTTCHDFIRRDDGMRGHKIYPAMTEFDPDFVVHAGDIEYYDKPDPWAMTVELMRFKWGRIFSLPNNRAFYSNTTSYFLKDDHDTLRNDCWAGQTYGSVTFEEGVRIFNEEQFPSHTPRYKTVRWGRDLQVWFLEGRDYRSPNNLPDGPDKTILGAEQKAWLFDTLQRSDATFKLICSPTPIVGPDRKNKKDNHANEVFAHEGEEIRTKLAEIDNVFVLCGDRHWQYASYDEQSDLWEFGCGPGSEKHELGWKPGDERPEHRFLRVKGGFLTGALRYSNGKDSVELRIRHRDVNGDPVSEFDFQADVRSDDSADDSDR
ncbi:family 16 glycoside hydrolase [Roseiconus nitratireducens]|nr:family 16 glycoside hydrolase [Roseiconus nitratireducens]